MNMLGALKSILKRILSQFNFELCRINKHGWHNFSLNQIPEDCRLYIGCGEDAKIGFIGCDIRPLPTVQLVCVAWEVSHYIQTAKEIFSRHMLEHLTNAEARAALADWYDALEVGGKIHVVVPNMDFHINQWINADWRESCETNSKTDANWGFAGFYGWQRECDPTQPNYNNTYWDVHKSGYDSTRIRCLLEGAGFKNVEVLVADSCHLNATAHKF